MIYFVHIGVGLAVDNNTVVTKWGINEDRVQPQYMWNISLSHHQVKSYNYTGSIYNSKGIMTLHWTSYRITSRSVYHDFR